MRRQIGRIAAALSLTAAPLALPAQVLTFEGLQNGEAVNEFYNGGTGGFGSAGPNYGVSFSPNSLALSSGNFAQNPSPPTILFFLSGGAATMNVAAGFTTGFSFFYSAANTPGAVTVYSGLNATGSVLATLNLPVTGTGAGCPATYCPWVPFGVTFAGVAQSVDFGGVADYIGFDDVTLGSAVPGSTVPEPATVLLLGAGLAGLGVVARRRRTA